MNARHVVAAILPWCLLFNAFAAPRQSATAVRTPAWPPPRWPDMAADSLDGHVPPERRQGEWVGDGSYGFTLRYRSVSDVVDSLVRVGLPRGLTSLRASEYGYGIVVKGSIPAVHAIRLRLEAMDGPSSRRAVVHAKLQDILATKADLAKAGVTYEELNEYPGTDLRQVTRKVEAAVRSGVLKAVPGAALAIEDRHTVTVGTRRKMLLAGTRIATVRPAPSHIRSSLTLRPAMDQFGRATFDIGMSVQQLASDSAPPDMYSGDSYGNNRVEVNDGETALLASFQEEARYEEVPGKSSTLSDAVWRLVLGTTTFEVPGRKGPLPPPHSQNTSDWLSADIRYLEAPAAAWRKAGIDPDVPAPVVTPETVDRLMSRTDSSEIDGARLDAYPKDGSSAVTALDSALSTIPLYCLWTFKGQPTDASHARVAIDLREVPPAGERDRKVPLLKRHFEWDVTRGPGGSVTDLNGVTTPWFAEDTAGAVILAGRKVPGKPGDIRRLTCIAIRVNDRRRP